MLFTDFKVKHTFSHQNRCDEWFWIQQNKILYTLCTYALLQLKIKRLHPKNNSRYCHLRGDLFSPRDNMIDHIWFMVVRNFQEHRRQVTFKLKIKMSDLDMLFIVLIGSMLTIVVYMLIKNYRLKRQYN